MIQNTIIGAIAGDVIGSIYEWNNIKRLDLQIFDSNCDYTDDTVLTIAIAECVLNGQEMEFAKTIKKYARAYTGRGYGRRFQEWVDSSNLSPYNSFGNGSAMRVSAIGFAYNDLEKVLEVARQSAEITHNHPEGIKGALATAAIIFLARIGKSKDFIREYISKQFQYNLNETIANIRPFYKFDETCQGSVPQAIIAFLESTDFENAIRLAISIGGDSDTIACITGGIASAFYRNIPEEIIDFVRKKLPEGFIKIIDEFDRKYSNSGASQF